MTGFIDPSIRAARKKEQSRHSKDGQREMPKAQEMLDLADAIRRGELVWCHPEGLGAINANGHQTDLIESALRIAAAADTRPDREGK